MSVGGQKIIETNYRPTVEDQINHIDHVVQVGGIDMISIGSDHMPYDEYGEYRLIDHCFYPIRVHGRSCPYRRENSYYVDGIDDVSVWPYYRRLVKERDTKMRTLPRLWD